MDYSDGYDGIAFGGTVDFDYVLPANIAIFSNTDFAFGINITDNIGMNLGLDAIYHPIKVWKEDGGSPDPRSQLSVIPKVCFVYSF